ncbi:MAG: hypothetical protein QM758_18980 [Armatimonas sp.]
MRSPSPHLLGLLRYPDAKLSLCSHYSEVTGSGPRATQTPSDEKPRDIINYYELRYPGGERKGNDEYHFSTHRR